MVWEDTVFHKLYIKSKKLVRNVEFIKKPSDRRTMMYACMYACMHACMYVCMHVCMRVCMYVYIYICTRCNEIIVPPSGVYFCDIDI